MLFSRVSSGLDFLDVSLSGLYSNRSYLVRGPSQSGRTTFALQFLLSGIENGETGIMISSDRIENVILRAEAMGITLENYLMDNRLILMEYPKAIRDGQYTYGTIVQLLGEIDQYIRHYSCSRLVFDTLHPLLITPSEPQLVNYIYSLMNSLEELNVTTLVTTGEPNSQKALRIIQLLEDAAIGSFVLSTTGIGEQVQRMFTVHKMLDRISPPMTFKIRIDYGVGIVQDLKTEVAKSETFVGGKRVESLTELPLYIGILEKDEDMITSIEDMFHPESVITTFENETELQSQLMHLECDLFILNASQNEHTWQRIITNIREYFPKLPIFLYTDSKTSRLTGKMAKLGNADGLFTVPMSSRDVIKALEKAHLKFGTLDELITKRSALITPDSLPEDFEESGERSKGEEEESHILTPAAFRTMLSRQIWKSKQDNTKFALVSFKMVYISEMSKIPHLPQGLELVRTITNVVTASLRGLNDSTCRYMDKVIVLLEDTDPVGAKAFASRVIDDLKQELSNKLNIQIGRHLNILNAFSSYTGENDSANDLWAQVTTDVSRNFIKLHS